MFTNIYDLLNANLIQVADVTKLDDEAYALLRKDSFGASDSSVILDVNLYRNKEQLIIEKRSKFLTDDEKEVSKKPAVKKGKDLEPFVLEKFAKRTGLSVLKPSHMYKHKEFEYLTTNFDGIAEEDTNIIPVEAKIVTKYGEKYYKKHMVLDKNLKVIVDTKQDIVAHIKYWADKCGIPAYYYTQVQQQIMFLDTEVKKCPYGYLTVIFDDSWDDRHFFVPRDELVISHIISGGAKLWEKIIDGSL